MDVLQKKLGGISLPAFGLCVDCLPTPREKKKVIENVAREFEAFFLKEFLKTALPQSGELQKKYGYFYREIIVDTLAKTSSFGVADFLKKAIEQNLEAMERGFIRKRNFGKF